MERAGDDFCDRADLGEAPGIHHSHPVGGLGDHAHIMGDQHHRHAAFPAEPFQERDDLGLHADIERRGGLIGDDEFRFGGQCEGDHDPLTHAA